MLFLVRHMDPTMKVRESVGRHEKPAVRPRKFATHKKKRMELGKNKLISKTVQWILIYKTKNFCFEKWSFMKHK